MCSVFGGITLNGHRQVGRVETGGLREIFADAGTQFLDLAEGSCNLAPHSAMSAVFTPEI